MYAMPLNAIEERESLLGNVPIVSGNDLLRSVLINEGASGSLQSYYVLVRDNDLTAWVELLLHRKRLREMQIKKRILSERLERRRLGQLSLGDILTPRATARRSG